MKSFTETRVIENVSEFRQWLSEKGKKELNDDRPALGFVPTMGALHAGHLALVRQAVQDCRHVVVSIFVNPLQFGPQEDFGRYPRTFKQDLELCREAGVSVVLHPVVEDLYPGGCGQSTKVVPPASLTDCLCGLFRPGHFTGVATVVLKLLDIVQPQQAYFGQKDFQQLAIIRRMVSDLNLPVKVVSVPTVRDNDGLALSSRNVYLLADERARAVELYKTLCQVRDDALAGRFGLQQCLERGRERLAKVPEITLQYLEACDPLSLEPVRRLSPPAVILVAARVGNVRLIDNMIVKAPAG